MDSGAPELQEKKQGWATYLLVAAELEWEGTGDFRYRLLFSGTETLGSPCRLLWPFQSRRYVWDSGTVVAGGPSTDAPKENIVCCSSIEMVKVKTKRRRAKEER